MGLQKFVKKDNGVQYQLQNIPEELMVRAKERREKEGISVRFQLLNALHEQLKRKGYK